MSDIAILNHRGVSVFDPKKTKENLSLASAGLKHAQRIKDWDMLTEAVKFIVNEQRDFLEAWAAEVQHGGQVRSLDMDHTWHGISARQASRWRSSLKHLDKYMEVLRGPSYKKAMAGVLSANRGAETTHENEWFTPSKYIEMARDVMGVIDLDPASHRQANEIVGAEKFYTLADDGLSQDWLGKVWLNPPYAQPLIGHFMSKLVQEVALGNVCEAIALTHNYTDTAWFYEAANACHLICFTRGRVRFESPDGSIAAPTQGQAFFYFGGNPDGFNAVFSEAGFVVSRF